MLCLNKLNNKKSNQNICILYSIVDLSRQCKKKKTEINFFYLKQTLREYCFRFFKTYLSLLLKSITI